MIKLKNVSKFYYNKGVIASGFSKINLELKMGEFVVLTGESGSGKSTLLNVISGLDTYEEGEMYINGEETSHYGEEEREIYRKKYIGNIFQYFYLVNSYTVYQNIELVLLLNGFKKHEVKDKVNELIKTVDLYRFRHTKVSKLSGGQKQRVAIARALAKDTPIIVADEPTGNLDSRSAGSIMKLLSEISKNKLVIIVTHNYEQVEEYATRKIKMHDGKILEDKVLKKTEKVKAVKTNEYKDLTLINKIRLGSRNAFNIFPKFILMFIVYFFIIMALFFEYSSNEQQEYLYANGGYNQFFRDTTDKRIIIKKNDLTSFNDEDYKKIKALDNIDYIVENDLLLDTNILLNNNDYYLSGVIKSIDFLEGDLDYGRMPENEYEIVVMGSKQEYYLSTELEGVLKAKFKLDMNSVISSNERDKYKIVGVKYVSSDYFDNTSMGMIFYASNEMIDSLKYNINPAYSKIKVLFNNTYYESNFYSSYFRVVPSSKVSHGNALVSDNLKYNCKNNNCKNYEMKILVDNLYYDDELTVKINDTYTKKNFKNKTSLNDYDYYTDSIFVNEEDYNALFAKDNYQSSVFIKNFKEKAITIKALEELDLKTLAVSETLITDNYLQILKVFKLVAMVVIIVVLFFISYFVIKIILKSRNVYFSTIRILGASKKISKQLLNIELLAVSNLAYLIFLILDILVVKDVLKLPEIGNLISFLDISDYLILYVIVTLMTLLISHRFARKLFKESAITTYYEEV